MFRRLLILLLAAHLPVDAKEPEEVLRAAMREAQARRAAILVDFHAPWCYSCYYMARHVHTGPEWEELRRNVVLLELDVDAPEGRYWMDAWNVQAIPTYVVLDAEAQELGRVLGEQTRAEFYGRIHALTRQSDTLSGLMASVRDDSPASVAAAREVLRIFHARYDAAGGLEWFVRLPPAWRVAVTLDPQAALAIARLELMRAHAEKDTSACVRAGRAVLNGDLGCDRPYELSRLLSCAAGLPADERAAVLRPQVEPMQQLLEQRLFSASQRCADERSIVLKTADLYQALGEEKPAIKLLDEAIDDVQDRLGRDVGRDRNLADNLRVYLERAGRHRKLDKLYRKLMRAYPDDYVYAYRYGKSLAGRGRHDEAVPLFALASRKAYGVNRLHVAEAWARSYQALGRPLDGQWVLAQALREAGPWFAAEAARLRSLRSELAATPVNSATAP